MDICYPNNRNALVEKRFATAVKSKFSLHTFVFIKYPISFLKKKKNTTYLFDVSIKHNNIIL